MDLPRAADRHAMARSHEAAPRGPVLLAALAGALGLWGVLVLAGLLVLAALEAGLGGAEIASSAPVGAGRSLGIAAGLATTLALTGFGLGFALRPRARAGAPAIARHEAALRDAHLRFEAALANMSQGLCLYDRDNVLLVVNRRFCEIYRLDPARIVPGITFRDVMAASIAVGNHTGTDVDQLVSRRLAFVSRREAATAFQELADGRVIAISHEPMGDGGWVVTYEDITERRRTEARIAHLARHDGLTGLPNRTQFRERIDAALAAGKPFAVLAIDLDDFRAVNESHGQPAGDAVLREAAARISASVPEGSIVARLGADEFAVLQWPVAAADAAACLAERLIAELSTPIQVGAREIQAGAAIGIALAPGDADGTDGLISHADLACQLARRQGRNSYRFFEPGMDARQQKRRLLEADLRQALANREFQIHYQPLIAIPSGEVAGFEALLRWRHPRRGLVSPAEFIPLAEQLDLISPIGAWVLGQACEDAARFPGSPRIAVNVSPLQFRRPGLVEAVADALSRSGLAPERLELEITETVLLDDSEMTRETLHRLRALGARIAIDDFGTGYSSLRMLRGFPFDKIKIDQSFIRDLGISPDARSIVNAISGLGRALGMGTTAEGVETEEQLAALTEEGCTEAQGYLFSRPRPAEEIPALLRTLAARLETRRERDGAGAAATEGNGQAAA
ncbi:MAG: EAL domain-containing protein [Acetobacteraceae bacterium]|nr:EAL domain-containing protein [Acetobacteraceae bacterium]